MSLLTRFDQEVNSLWYPKLVYVPVIICRSKKPNISETYLMEHPALTYQFSLLKSHRGRGRGRGREKGTREDRAGEEGDQGKREGGEVQGGRRGEGGEGWRGGGREEGTEREIWVAALTTKQQISDIGTLST